MALWDRFIRFVLGVLLTAYAIAGGPFWAFFGVYGLLTSAWGLCPIYAFFRFRTLQISNRNTRDTDTD